MYFRLIAIVVLGANAQADAKLPAAACAVCEESGGQVCGEIFNDCESEPDTACSTAVSRRESFSSCAELRARHAIFLFKGACGEGTEKTAPASCFQPGKGR